MDEGSFAATLSRHFSSLLATGQLRPGSGLWSIAVEGLLVRSVAISTEVHEEVWPTPKSHILLLLSASLCPGFTAPPCRNSQRLHRRPLPQPLAPPTSPCFV